MHKTPRELATLGAAAVKAAPLLAYDLKLCDFGLVSMHSPARDFVRDAKLRIKNCGTASFMVRASPPSPSVTCCAAGQSPWRLLNNECHPGEDVYALGLTLLECAHGKQMLRCKLAPTGRIHIGVAVKEVGSPTLPLLPPRGGSTSPTSAWSARRRRT